MEIAVVTRRILSLLGNLPTLLVLSVAPGCQKAPPVPAKVAPDVIAAPVAAKPPEGPTPAQVAQQQAASTTVGEKTAGFVVIPAGKFTMGASPSELEPGAWNDAPQHEVTISRPIEMQVAETTQEAFKSVMAGNVPVQPKVCPECPVLNVSWFQATGYCNALSRLKKLAVCYEGQDKDVHFTGLNCHGYRLPTEAEWEYAARAGTTTPRYGETAEIAWIDTNTQLEPQPVKGKKPNPWGLFDMLGNAHEWVNDWQGDYPTAAVTDPMGPATGENRVFRGGAYRLPEAEARAAFRNGYGPANQVEFIGFRCVRTL
jgi:formylglycine-generating enzyme required for sulfatase activity